MTEQQKTDVYKQLIDSLVEMCKDGQGQIGARRARDGVWNQNATKELIPDQHEINLLLARMTEADREILSRMLAHEVELGVFETLKALEEFEIEPFTEGYEGSPYHDFTGRMSDWEWPEGNK